ncbi:outer membrane lipoprotein carrier protein LolA [Streptomyces sp. NPDC053367]|uniref:outer membrane lipoprotein carrier protein LolA n=1 Tax=Streptomyces sp. NPDC053367 TaxID=3365700 RepID=UPI0037D0C502
MAPYESDESTTAAESDDQRAGRRRAARYVVPVAVTGVAVATIGLVPALADSGSPDLPKISAEQLVQHIAESDTEQLSGTVRVNTDLGLPDLGGLESGLLAGAAQDGAGGEGSAADPSARLTELASGTHTLRVAADGPDRQKVSLLQDAAEYSVIHNGKDVWGYDSKSNEVYHSTTAESGKAADVPATPKDFAEQALKAVDDTTSVTVDGTARVAGRDTYKLLIKPKQSGTTVGAISIAVDAKTWTPLKFTLTPAGGGAAVVDVGFTQVSFARPAASTFDFAPPKGAKVTQGDSHEHPTAAQPFETEEDAAARGTEGMNTIGEGWNAIATFDTGGEGIPSGEEAGDFGGFLDSLGDHVSGKFGSGTVFETRLINALITEDGKVYVGAVTEDALVKAAESRG